MTRIAPALFAAAAIAFAAPASAADSCDPAELLYADGHDVWINSDGLVDATQRMGGEYPTYFLKMWSEASDGEHGFDVEVRHALHWFGEAQDADAEQTIAYIAEQFSEAAEEYRADKEALEDDIRANRRNIRRMQRKIRGHRRAIDRLIAESNSRDPETRAKVSAIKVKVISLTAEMNRAKAELQDLREEHRKVARAAADLEEGVTWAKTMACLAEGLRR